MATNDNLDSVGEIELVARVCAQTQSALAWQRKANANLAKGPPGRVLDAQLGHKPTVIEKPEVVSHGVAPFCVG